MKVLSAFVAILAVAAARVAITPSMWTLQELDAALFDPSTPAELKPYITEAFDNLMQEIFAGGVQTSAPVITPYGFLPAPSAVAVVDRPTPTDNFAPISPAEVTDHAVAAAPAAEPGSPLVQIIVNIKSEQLQAINPSPVVVSPVPEAVIPTPVAVVEQPAEIAAPTPVEVIDVPTPVNPIDVIAIAPPEISPVDVIDVPTPINPIDVIAIAPPEISPVDVIDVPTPINPIDVIAITPPEIINPVDVIAISPPEPINPVDVIAISPPEPINPVDVIAISPPEPINPIDVIAIAAPEVNPIDIMAPLPAVAGGNEGIIV